MLEVRKVYENIADTKPYGTNQPGWEISLNLVIFNRPGVARPVL